LKVITLNVNGIRSAERKGLFRWLPRQKADIVCLQEVKAHEADLTPQMLAPKGYLGHFHCAQKKGYAGVALYSRVKPARGNSTTKAATSKRTSASWR
jgi:exodeoxyribonuclease-3